MPDLNQAARPVRMVLAWLLVGSLLAMDVRSQSLLLSIEAQVDENLGSATGPAGDVNNDGLPDVIIGIARRVQNGVMVGGAIVVSGSDGALLHEFVGTNDGGQFGAAVDGAGDVNNDGFDDLIVGAPRDDSAGKTAGRAFVYSGQTGDLLYTFDGLLPRSAFGSSVSGVGDVNADGHDDVIVGAPMEEPSSGVASSVRVFSGIDGSVLYLYQGPPVILGPRTGQSVSEVGDVNNDGVPDFAYGAPGTNVNGLSSGAVRVCSGLDGSELFAFFGDTLGDFLGNSVAAAGDVNNDGFADVIAGARTANPNGENTGMARVYSGQTGSVLYTFGGDSEGDKLGTSVAGGADLDGDGVVDLVAGAAFGQFPTGPQTGIARVYSGSDGRELYTFRSAPSADAFGSVISIIGDTNADGLAELAVSGFQQTVNGPQSGVVRIFSLAPIPDEAPDHCNGDGGDQMGCTDCPCSNNSPLGTLGGCLNSAQRSARIEATGNRSISLQPNSTVDLRVSLAGGPSDAFGVLMSGAEVTPRNPSSPCFGANSGLRSVLLDGLRCITGDVRRHGGRAMDEQGRIGVINKAWGGEGGPNAGLAVAFGGFSSGETRFFQVTYRDSDASGCMSGLNTSQAIEIQFTP